MIAPPRSEATLALHTVLFICVLPELAPTYTPPPNLALFPVKLVFTIVAFAAKMVIAPPVPKRVSRSSASA